MKTNQENITMVCLVCNKDIGSIITSDYPDNAVIWETKGNYGSTVYDSPNESGYLIAYVCDDCMEERQDRLITAITILPEQRPAQIYKQGIHGDPASYAPHQETINVVRAIANLPQCPLCHQEGRHRNACKMKNIAEFFDHEYDKRKINEPPG